jgi:hypothetical protein
MGPTPGVDLMDTTPIVPTATLHRALTKSLGVAQSVAPQVEYLQTLAAVCPAIAQSVDELSIMHASLDRLCRVGLGGQVTDLGDATRG